MFIYNTFGYQIYAQGQYVYDGLFFFVFKLVKFLCSRFAIPTNNYAVTISTSPIY